MREGDDGTIVRAIDGTGTEGKAVRSILGSAVGVIIEGPLEGEVVGFRESPLEGVVVGFREGPLEGVEVVGFREGPLEGTAEGLREDPLEGGVVGFREGPVEDMVVGFNAKGTITFKLTVLGFVGGIFEGCLVVVGAAIGIIEIGFFPWVTTAALSSSMKFKTVVDFDVMNCDGKEQLGGRRGLQSLLILSHCPEQHGMASFVIYII